MSKKTKNTSASAEIITSGISDEFINAACGVLIVEVTNSNPNGDPDCGGEPRMKQGDDTGLISDVCIKRKLRDLVLFKEGPVYKKIASDLKLDDSAFGVVEARGRNFKAIQNQKTEDVLKANWDSRVFGTNFLSKESSHINSGAVQIGLGTSIAPVKILSFTHSKCCSVEEKLDRGMAPKGYKVVEHGLYAVPFFVNPTSAKKSNCTKLDIEVFKRMVPYMFTHSISRSRAQVSIQAAWYVDLGSPLGCFNPVKVVEHLMPKKKGNPNVPSKSLSDYEVPTSLPKEMTDKGLTLQSLI